MNTKKDLVTAVITTYKRESAILERALKSILNQTYNNIEVIIVNDCPDDIRINNDIKKMLKKYNNNDIKYIVVKKNGGACKARNIALNTCKGEYIAFLDDDDEWLPHKIESQVNKFKESKNCGIVYCNSISYTVETETQKNRFVNIQPEGNIHEILLKKNLIGSCSFPMFNVEILKEFNGFREDMPALQDWELYIRISKKYNASYIHEPCVKYYFYNGERISRNSKNRIIAYEKILEEIKEELNQNNSAAYEYYMMGVYFYSISRNIKRAFIYYFKAVKLNKRKIKNNITMLIKMIGRFIIKPKRV